MAYSRRKFIKYSSLASASLLMPDFLKSLSLNLNESEYKGKILVIIQLSGGNDGLNTLVPYRNDLYYKYRPAIGLKKKEIITLNDEVAFNINMQAIADIYNNSELTIINNVGYPNPNRSHFRSTDIWHSASSENQIWQTGWIGRYLDANCNNEQLKPHQAIEVDDTLSLVLKGDKIKGIAFKNAEILNLSSKNHIINAIAKNYSSDNDNSNLDFLHKTLAETNQSAEYIYTKSKVYKSQKIYPQNEFGKSMKTIAELICSGTETKVYYLSLPGFDTHALQRNIQDRLLKNYSQTIKVFCDDLKQHNRFNDTLILTFSEFGRRVKQNASNGTDHGAANNVFIVGGKLAKTGVINEMPNLSDLNDGDIQHSVDFRQIYATILDKHFNFNHETVLKNKFHALNFI